MPDPSTHVAPTKLASIQTFVSRAGFFWRGGAASLAIVFGASVAVAFVVGDVYESESVLEFVDGGGPKDPPAEPPDVQLQRAVLDPAAIEKLARETGPVGAEGPALQAEIERIRGSIQIRAREDKRFAIAFRSETAASAQRGSDWLAQAAMRTVAARNDPFGGEEVSKNVKALEERTRDLAAFVAEHPEVAISPSGPTPAPDAKPATSASGGKAAPPPADSAMLVLQQQKATLEWRLADAEKKEAGGENPYDSVTDRAALQRMIAQVKAAIAARQAVAMRTGAESSAAASAGRTVPPPPKSPASAALQAEWQRLVEAVVQAQVQAPVKREGAAPSLGLRIVQRASLPTRPIKPDKRLIGLLGLAVGVWASIIWAFARVLLKHDLRATWADAADDFADESPPEEPEEEPGWRVQDGLDHTALHSDVVHRSTPPATAKAGTHAEVVGEQGIAGLRPYAGGSRSLGVGPTRVPKDLMTTAPGVVDVSRVLAQTGIAPDRIRPAHGVSIVEATPRDEPLVSNPQREADAARPGTYGLHREAAIPPQTTMSPIRATGVTQTFVSPSPAGKQGSHAPAPGPGHHAAPPTEQAPVYGLALRSRPPEDIFALRDVPRGWSPDPSMLQSGSMKELLTLRDQLYRLAVNGCFVVGVTSARGAATDKSCVAAQLASVLAAPGKARVLLMEADFDRPAVHRLMHIDVPFSHGFSQQMRRRMTPGSRVPWTLVRCAPNLHVLAEGLVRSPGLLSSVQFGEALSELRAYYDVIVTDGPIAGGTVDTCAFDALMDGIVVVGAVGSAPSKLLDEASKWFGRKQLMAVISADASAEQRIEFGSKTT
jgi:Mrp family chromosome partitioning ATPase